MRDMRFYPEAWPLHTAFVIARGSRTEARVVVVEIEQQDVRGIGECTPYPRYGESEESVMAQLAEMHSTSVTAPAHIRMAQTVSIGTPEAMAFAARELEQQGATLLKIKLDDHYISERLVAIRAAVPQATLIVDANESWQAEGLAARCQLLADLGVAMLEQPLPAGDDAALEHFIHPLPICADESCHTRADLPRLAQRYQMVNIKLDKTGGLTEALALAQAAREQGFAIMLGCMLCTSRAISAALPLAPAARFVDLDGPTWLARDVEPGLAFECGAIVDIAP